eukprot:gnl/Trimastix_PCT/2406.p1 GENE.gnl/Trimastix_PCT/2406~~gnl/Trimastix_PCT/2406.p1  ORF type:complete len:496 (+),score=90.19 gnl/Trimastix_PCT/2406:80-1567(+)
MELLAQHLSNLSLPSPSDTSQLYCAKQLRHYSATKEYREQLCRMPEAIDALCGFLILGDTREGPNVAQVSIDVKIRCQRYALEAMLNLLLENPRTDSLLLCDVRCLPGLMSILDDPPDLYVQECAACCLDYLSVHKDNQVIIGTEAGLVELLVALLRAPVLRPSASAPASPLSSAASSPASSPRPARHKRKHPPPPSPSPSPRPGQLQLVSAYPQCAPLPLPPPPHAPFLPSPLALTQTSPLPRRGGLGAKGSRSTPASPALAKRRPGSRGTPRGSPRSAKGKADRPFDFAASLRTADSPGKRKGSMKRVRPPARHTRSLSSPSLSPRGPASSVVSSPSAALSPMDAEGNFATTAAVQTHALQTLHALLSNARTRFKIARTEGVLAYLVEQLDCAAPPFHQRLAVKCLGFLSQLPTNRARLAAPGLGLADALGAFLQTCASGALARTAQQVHERVFTPREEAPPDEFEQLIMEGYQQRMQRDESQLEGSPAEEYV